MVHKYIIGVVGETPTSPYTEFHTEAENMEKAWYNLVEKANEIGQSYKMKGITMYDEKSSKEFKNNQFNNG
jgi:hypothetical protein